MIKITIASIIFLFLISIGDLFADNRSYVWTYEYITMEKGNSELEQYTTFKTLDNNDFENTTSSELNLEFEVGMTNNFDVGIYQNFKQDINSSFVYDGFKIRTRYKIGEKEEYFADFLIYFEYINNANLSKNEFEPKLIIAKDYGNFNISFNPYLEIEKEEKEWEFKPKYAVGTRYKFGKLFSFGLEFKGDAENHYIGPTISHGNQKMYFALGSLFGYSVQKEKPKFQMRVILGFEL